VRVGGRENRVLDNDTLKARRKFEIVKSKIGRKIERLVNFKVAGEQPDR